MTFMTMTSCQSASTPDPRTQAAMAAPVPDVQARQNPAPKRTYALALRFTGLPAAVTRLSVTANYAVDNLDCVPVDYTRAIGGIRLPPEQRIELTLQKIDDNTYATTVSEDAFLDEDYYGLGVCHWALGTASVHFHSPSTQFVGGISADQLTAEGEVTEHYLVRDFAQKPAVGDVVFGEDSPNFYLASLGPQFKLSISARREAP
jgi:hypothetical protein